MRVSDTIYRLEGLQKLEPFASCNDLCCTIVNNGSDTACIGEYTLGAAKTLRSEFEYIMSMKDRLGEYVDQWIAVVDNQIVARGNNAKDVFRKAKALHPTKTPFIMRVPADRVMVL